MKAPDLPPAIAAALAPWAPPDSPIHEQAAQPMDPHGEALERTRRRLEALRIAEMKARLEAMDEAIERLTVESRR